MEAITWTPLRTVKNGQIHVVVCRQCNEDETTTAIQGRKCSWGIGIERGKRALPVIPFTGMVRANTRCWHIDRAVLILRAVGFCTSWQEVLGVKIPTRQDHERESRGTGVPVMPRALPLVAGTPPMRGHAALP